MGDAVRTHAAASIVRRRSLKYLKTLCQRRLKIPHFAGRKFPHLAGDGGLQLQPVGVKMEPAGEAEAGAELVRLARSVGLVRGEWIAIDGSKFQAASSARSVREREAMKHYLEQLEQADEQDEVVIDPGAAAAALEKLNSHPESEARFMRTGHGHAPAPAYNVQTAVDAEHALIVAQHVTTEATDNRSLLPMAEAAKQAVGAPDTLNVVADAGYSNGEQAERCEQQGIVPHVPANRAINNKGDGTLLDRSRFHYDEKTDTFRCPNGATLVRIQLSRRDRCVMYAAAAGTCGTCSLKTSCTTASRRWITRHLHEGALTRMQQRATPEAMRLRRSTVEHPFATLKYRIFGNPRFLLRGLAGAQTEIGLATMVYNLKRMINVLGGCKLAAALAC